MRVLSYCAFKCGAFTWLGADARFVMTVYAKGTYRLSHGTEVELVDAENSGSRHPHEGGVRGQPHRFSGGEGAGSRDFGPSPLDAVPYKARVWTSSS